MTEVAKRTTQQPTNIITNTNSTIINRIGKRSSINLNRKEQSSTQQQLNHTMSKALIIVGVQNDFCENGSLAVPGSNDIFAPINALKKRKDIFSHVIICRDWHHPKHISFASTHLMKPFPMLTTIFQGQPFKFQQLWPDHCVAGTYGAQFSPLLHVDPSDIIIDNGVIVNVDSYSAFDWNSSKSKSKLKCLIQQLKIEQVYVVGLAFDFCVGATALDAKLRCHIRARVIKEGTKSLRADSEQLMRERLQDNKIDLISLAQIDQEE